MARPKPSRQRLITGATLAFKADPFRVPPEEAIEHHADGAVLIENGSITAVGDRAKLIAKAPKAAREAHPGRIILAGFIDAHVHYPQIGIIASYGEQLIAWLNRYTFPEELRFADPAVAAAAAEAFLDETLRHGVTTSSVYCTVHPASVDAIFTAADARGLRLIAGKVMMDRNAPPGLTDTPSSGYDQSKALIARWQGTGRLGYVITPRFAPTSSPGQLEAAGALWSEHPACLMQTHIDESKREIAWVQELFPASRDYLDAYERFGLVGPGANFGHAIHLKPRERRRLAETGSGISHCPTSNLFIGSGLFDLHGLAALKSGAIPVGLGTDVGGGSSFSMLATMKAAYEIAQLRGKSLHPLQAFYLATCGGARLLRLQGTVGNLVPGAEADLVVLDPTATPLLAERTKRAASLSDVLFALMILGDDRAIAATYIAGSRVTLKPRAKPGSPIKTASSA